MIAKKVSMRAARKSSFAELVAYLISDQGNEVRVGSVRISNCENPDVGSAVLEVLSSQARNRRSTSDKTYHLILSFPAGEVPPVVTLHAIEDRVCAALGFTGHQRISVVHRDTDNLHIHVAINKVHPTTQRVHDPWQDFKTLGNVCEELEVALSLQRDNHEQRCHHTESASRDAELRSGVESLVSWVRRTCADAMLRAQSWSELHMQAGRRGLTLQERGSGLVVVDYKGLAVRASLVDRALGKGSLESRLGPFVPSLGAQVPAASSINEEPAASGEDQVPNELPTDGAAASPLALDPAPLLACSSWREFHEKLAALGAQARLRGAGLVLQNRTHQTRASELSRHLSLKSLEQRWGPFESDAASARQLGTELPSRVSQVDTHQAGLVVDGRHQSDRLWQLYLQTRSPRSAEYRLRRRAANRLLKGEVAAAFRRAEVKRGLIRHLGKGRTSKYLLYVSTHATLQRELATIRARHDRMLAEVDAAGHRMAWTDWLKRRALGGDDRALALLRMQAPPRAAGRNAIVGNDHSGARAPGLAQAVTSKGTVICRSGSVEWRESRDAFVVTSDVEVAELGSILSLAARRLGPRLRLDGTAEFKRKALEAAVRFRIAVAFDDPELEALRQSRTHTSSTAKSTKENMHGAGTKPPGGAWRNVASGRRGLLFESNSAGRGHSPASGAAFDLRTMSQLDVVQYSTRTEVLLPHHARGDLEHPRTGSIDPLRRTDALTSESRSEGSRLVRRRDGGAEQWVGRKAPNSTR